MNSILIKSARNFGLDEELLKIWTEKLLKKYKLDNCELSLFFVGPEKIRVLNRQYRNLDEPTSVLTFFQGQVYPEFNRGTPEKILLLGDIVICPFVAKKRNLSIKFLIEHGIRNLLSEIPPTKSLRT